MVREAWFRDPVDATPIPVDFPTRVLCLALIAGILALGVMPGRVMSRISDSVAALKTVASEKVAATHDSAVSVVRN